MTDKLTKERRSWNMSRIKGKDTKPEKLLRSMLFRRGLRFRIHYPKLRGKPDIVFPGKHAAIFVHGCYWHRHEGCPKATTPSTNTEFWQEKFRRTVERDRETEAAIRAAGWKVLTVWECELESDPGRVLATVESELKGGQECHA